MMAMPDRRPAAIDTTVQKTYGWLHELETELGAHSRAEAYDILRGFLHTLRDRLTVDQAAHLGAQLPMLVRGLFYEGWQPSQVPKKMKADEFLEAFAQGSGHPADSAGRPVLQAAARVVSGHLEPGEWLNVLSALPHDVRDLLE